VLGTVRIAMVLGSSLVVMLWLLDGAGFLERSRRFELLYCLQTGILTFSTQSMFTPCEWRETLSLPWSVLRSYHGASAMWSCWLTHTGVRSQVDRIRRSADQRFSDGNV
jgi:hypothetical protein